MTRFAPLFTAVTLGLSLCAIAEDTDPGYSERRPWYGGRQMYDHSMYDQPTIGATGLIPLYYRPTMRYYGNGYVVNYRYIPVYKGDALQSGAVAGSSNFRTEAFHLSTDEAPGWGATSPRLTVKDPHSAAPRTAVTTIIRKKSGKGSKVSTEAAPTDAPAITPSTSPAPAPGASPAPKP